MGKDCIPAQNCHVLEKPGLAVLPCERCWLPWWVLHSAPFAVSAPLATDCFGMTHFGAIFGLVFMAYGFVAGPLGPWLSGHVLDSTQGNFQVVFTYLVSIHEGLII